MGSAGRFQPLSHSRPVRFRPEGNGRRNRQIPEPYKPTLSILTTTINIFSNRYFMKKYNFDEIITREGTNSIKYDARERFFKNAKVLPLWVADTDFRTPDFIVEAVRERANHE